MSHDEETTRTSSVSSSAIICFVDSCPSAEQHPFDINSANTMKTALTVAFLGSLVATTNGYALVARNNAFPTSSTAPAAAHAPTARRQQSSSSLAMIDDQVVMGGAIVVAGLVAGIGLVAFTEKQGERAKERGSGLSEGMSTRIAGGLLEDVEVSSVDDLGTLTGQMEKALREAGGANAKELEMSEESKKRIAEEADDGW